METIIMGHIVLGLRRNGKEHGTYHNGVYRTTVCIHSFIPA